MSSLNVLEILLDEKNNDPIVLEDKDGKSVAFEQIAVIPYQEKIYCILKPIDRLDGVAMDEALVFSVEEIEDSYELIYEQDEMISLSVFDEYYQLLEERLGMK